MAKLINETKAAKQLAQRTYIGFSDDGYVYLSDTYWLLKIKEEKLKLNIKPDGKLANLIMRAQIVFQNNQEKFKECSLKYNSLSGEWVEGPALKIMDDVVCIKKDSIDENASFKGLVCILDGKDYYLVKNGDGSFRAFNRELADIIPNMDALKCGKFKEGKYSPVQYEDENMKFMLLPIKLPDGFSV